MTADTFRQASLFEWVPRPLTVKAWNVPDGVLIRSAARQFLKDLWKVPNPQDYEVRVHAQYSSFATEDEQRYIRISGRGLYPLFTFIEIDSGEITKRIQGEKRGEYRIIDRVLIEGDRCIVNAEGTETVFRLADADWTVDYPRERYWHDEAKGNPDDCGTVALNALLLGYDPERVECLTYGPVNSTIFSPTKAMAYPESADLLMELAEHHGLPTWLNQDVPDRYESGMLGYISSCADCRHMALCHPGKDRKEYRNQCCSDYGRDFRIKGKIKAPKFDDEEVSQ